MRIKPDEVVAGFPARRIRELLRQSVDSLSAHHATKILEIEMKQARQLLDRLQRDGFLKKNPVEPNSDREHSWRRTVKGGALANALFSKPVSRQSAEKTLSKFLDRVREVNHNSRFLYRVRKVILFGSFLSDAPFVGDLDLAVDLCPKEKDGGKHSELIRARANQALSRGKHFQNYVEGLRFAEHEVMTFLKARSRVLQFTCSNDGVLNIAECRVIYESADKDSAVPMNPLPKRRVHRLRKRPDGCPF